MSDNLQRWMDNRTIPRYRKIRVMGEVAFELLRIQMPELIIRHQDEVVQLLHYFTMHQKFDMAQFVEVTDLLGKVGIINSIIVTLNNLSGSSHKYSSNFAIELNVLIGALTDYIRRTRHLWPVQFPKEISDRQILSDYVAFIYKVLPR